MNDLSTLSTSGAFDKADQAIDNAFALAVGEPTMSSREIAELTGKEHSNVLRDTRNMLESLDDSNLNDEYYQVLTDARGYTSEILFNKNLSLLLVSGYNINLRMAIIKRWQELEAQTSKHELPQTFAEALKLAYEQQLVIEQQQAQISVMQPKSEYFDMLVERNHVTSFTDTAKQIGVGVHQFTNFLLDKGYCFRQQTTGKKKGVIKPCVEHASLFEIKDFSVTNTQTDKTYSNVQTLVSPDGKSLFMALKDLILTYPKKSMF